MARPAAVLDANVLYPARLRDLLLRLAIAGLYRALWTERILDECFENLSNDRPISLPSPSSGLGASWASPSRMLESRTTTT